MMSKTRDHDCVSFLRWALPRLSLRWPGFRKVRGQVCKRLKRRLRTLGLADLAAYRAFLEDHPDEWTVVDDACRVTISRFYRDRGVYESLERHVLPAVARSALAREDSTVRVWSVGCASGEEPYSVKLVWELAVGPRFPALELWIVATDVDPHMLERARQGEYPSSSVRELPEAWVERAFRGGPESYVILERWRSGIELLRQDVRREMPSGTFDVVLCRNLVFTYFDLRQQSEILRGFASKLAAGGALIVGAHEALPAGVDGFVEWFGCPWRPSLARAL